MSAGSNQPPGPQKAKTSESSQQAIGLDFGSLVKEERKKRKWTLEQLSAACAVSRSMLSEIERNRANPTLAVAYRVAQAFGMSLGELVRMPEATQTIDVIRADDRAFHYRSDKDCKVRTLSPLHLEKDVEFYELWLRPGAALRSSPHFEGTREFLTLQKSSARLTCGDDMVELRKGDSAHYRADLPHAIENIGRGELIANLIVTYR